MIDLDIGTMEEYDHRQPPERVYVVYFLLANSRLVYIGRTCNLRKRLVVHRKEKPRFDRVLFVVSDEEESVRLERKLVDRLQPPWNDRPRQWDGSFVHHSIDDEKLELPKSYSQEGVDRLFQKLQK